VVDDQRPEVVKDQKPRGAAQVAFIAYIADKR
jgi:hypothetical protein